MKAIIFSAFFVLCAGAFLHAADVIILKDGTELEGEISAEDADTYTIKIPPVGGGLAVPRIVLKSDIRRVKEAGPDEEVFKTLQKLVPPPDRLTAEDYKERIGRGQAFLVRYPASAHTAAVKEIMKTLEEEHKLAAKGGLKFQGEWISPADRIQNAYEIDARIELADMKADFEAGRYHLALRHFEKMQSDFMFSESFEEARTLAVEALTAYRPAVSNDLARVDAVLKKRAVGIQRLPANLRAAEEAEIARQDRAYKNQVKKEQGSGTKWFTLNQYHEGPLRAVLNNINSTLKQLETPPEKDPKNASKVYREAWVAARQRDLETGKKLLTELKSLKVPARYLTKLDETLNPPEPDPDQPKIERVPQPAPETVTSEEKDPEPTESRTETPDEGTAPIASANDEEEKKGFSIQIILVIVLVLVIVGALLAAFGGKKR